MHPVLEHIIARKNKKVPLKDGRDIALVLFGGTMTGVRGAGALTALEDEGLLDAFDSIYTISAGFCNASYFLAEQAHQGSGLYFNYMIGPEFINMERVWKIVDTDYIVDVIRNIQKLNVDKIFASKTKLYVALDNLDEKRVDYLEIHQFGKKNFFDLMRGAISIPYLHPGGIELKHVHYEDYPLTEKLQHLTDHVLSTKTTDILIIYNHNQQVTIPALFSDRIYEVIIPQDRPMSRFEKSPKILKAEWRWMYEHVKNLLDPKVKV